MDFEDGKGISTVSLVWPVLTAQFETTWPKGLLTTPTTLLEVDRMICNIDRPEAVMRIPHATGNGYLTAYKSWDGSA